LSDKKVIESNSALSHGFRVYAQNFG
jgi:hypothetical protein